MSNETTCFFSFLFRVIFLPAGVAVATQGARGACSARGIPKGAPGAPNRFVCCCCCCWSCRCLIVLLPYCCCHSLRPVHGRKRPWPLQVESVRPYPEPRVPHPSRIPSKLARGRYFNYRQTQVRTTKEATPRSCCLAWSYECTCCGYRRCQLLLPFRRLSGASLFRADIIHVNIQRKAILLRPCDAKKKKKDNQPAPPSMGNLTNEGKTTKQCYSSNVPTRGPAIDMEYTPYITNLH